MAVAASGILSIAPYGIFVVDFVSSILNFDNGAPMRSITRASKMIIDTVTQSG